MGRFGVALARELERNGTEVLAVDDDEARVQKYSNMLAHIVRADATDLEALRELGAEEFNTAVVAVGTVEGSTLAVSNLVQLEVERIWGKALSTQHARILERVGATAVVQPEHDMGQRIAHLVSGEVLDYMQFGPNWVIAKTRPARFMVGVPLRDTGAREKYKITVVAVRERGEAPFTYADAETVLSYGNEILVMGMTKDVRRFAALD
jgi:trk system potassium uptake protein TrkA